MRIKITCDTRGGVDLPINYNHLLTGVIYQFLKESDPEYAHFLHQDGYELENRRFKLFTFSQLMAKKREIRGERIHFRSPLTWYISSSQEPFLQNFAASLMGTGSIQIQNHRLQVQDVEVLRQPRFGPQMTFRCLSPITMSTMRERDGQIRTHYCLPDDPQFSALVRQNLIRKYHTVYRQPPPDESFAMTFDQAYIDKRKGRVTRLVDFKGTKIRGIISPFHVIGAPELIRIGYECGFGDKNSAGFGMVETLKL
ncbi:CRISPR-associated endoribonuclease Cas6 [Candidatus Poribacteria bacterium]|nr:MAG: CRISPR-associated endoribonuclease Cas6 [Candidatus Poribacteria bacterium]